MSVKLYMVRHGYSEANKQNFFAGHRNAELDSVGKLQAQKLGEYFAEHRPDILYSSDLKRAVQTAEPVAKACSLQIIKCENLREINGGAWEGMPFSDIENLYPNEYRLWKSDIGRSVCPGGESLQQLSRRIIDAVTGICMQNDSKSVCIVTHATPIRAVCTHAAGLPVEDMKNIPFADNASVNIFEFSDGIFTPKCINYTEHLGALGIKTQL